MMQESLTIREKVLGQESAKSLRSASLMIWYFASFGNTDEAVRIG